MDEHDQQVFEEHLVDPDAAREFAGRFHVIPEDERNLRKFVSKLNAAAVQAARDLDLPGGVRFVVCPIHDKYWDDDTFNRWLESDADMPELDAEEPTVIGFKVLVAPGSRERLERLHREAPRFRAKSPTSVSRRDADLRARLPRGPRRRGAGRPGHRSAARANAPPADDDGPAEPEHDPPARRPRRAACCRGLVA